MKNLQPKSILEIGGGLGTLSERLVQFNALLTIVEKDSNLAVLLEQKFSTERTQILNTDVLELDPDQLRSYDVIIGNNPYEISSP